ncbi:MAG: DUF2064 domain-containing protein [Ornithinimicrobium sp.]
MTAAPSGQHHEPTTSVRILVIAKAPVPGLAKTRLAASVGDLGAAELAAAGLLDTLEASRAASADCVIALTGDMDRACRASDINDALRDWTVLWQRGDGFDERLAGAHLDAGDGPTIQIGMDTPQVSASMLHEAGSLLADHDTVLGPAEDGGWWVFGRHRAADADALRGVPMSTDSTCDDTRSALLARGLSVGTARTLRDVDEVADAQQVAAAAPHMRFAQVWQAQGGVR